MSNNKNYEREALLESTESKKIATVVKNLPSDELSLAWRSQLNEKLNQASEKKRKQKRWHRIWTYSSGFGVSCAAILTVVVLLNTQTKQLPAPVNPSTVEAQMLMAHNETSQATDVAGPGLSAYDDSDNSSKVQNVKWKEEDLEAL